MKVLRRNKRLFVIFLILFPMIMIFCTFVTNVQGGPFVPNKDSNNAWHWEVDAGDQLYFEGEFILTNATTGEVYMMYKDIWIYNITSIENVTINWLGMNNFSQVSATQCYYNVTSDELEAYYPSSEIALFGYNYSDAIQHKYRAGQGGSPLILPINGSNALEVDVLADILNESFYDPMYEMGAFNRYGDYDFNTTSNMIYFYNSTDGFFTESYYYDNGTLNYGKTYLMVQMTGDQIYVNVTMKQVFNYNITDEVQWSVNVGDTLYYDGIQNEYTADDSMEYKLNITGFSDVLLNKTNNGFSVGPIYMVYEAVIADLFIWNGTDYEIFSPDIPIGMANNFYPQYSDKEGPLPYNFLYPTSAGMEDYKFMWNNDTIRIWNFPFDEIYIYENGYIETVLKNSTGVDSVKTIVDKATGIVQSMFMLGEDVFMYFEIKTQTLVDWSVDIGNVFYYKLNEDQFMDVKVTIIETHTVYANMSWLVDQYNSLGVPLILPSGQPEYQFFSYILASFEKWIPTLNNWIFYDTSIIAIANIYWPVSPLIFEVGRPALLVPEGTSGLELADFFNMFSPAYDAITYNPGHIILRNSTLNKELHFYFDEPSGRITMMHGWSKAPIPGSEWTYMSIYPKFYQALAPGLNTFTLSTHFPTGTTIDVEVNLTGSGAAFISNFFPMNPVNVSLPEGTAFGFIDQLFTNSLLIDGNLTMTITLPPTIDLSSVAFVFYAYNMNGTNEWDAAPPEFYADYVTYNYVTNSITIETPPFPMGVILAMAYISLELPPEIPGYDLFLISILVIVISAIAIKIKRKKL